LVVGIVTGAISWSQTADIKHHCASDDSCAAALGGDLHSANTLGNIANVTVPLGLIGIGYGLYELLTLPSASTPTSQAALRIDFAPNAVRVWGRL
jgi:hypothetical protein